MYDFFPNHCIYFHILTTMHGQNHIKHRIYINLSLVKSFITGQHRQ